MHSITHTFDLIYSHTLINFNHASIVSLSHTCKLMSFKYASKIEITCSSGYHWFLFIVMVNVLVGNIAVTLYIYMNCNQLLEYIVALFCTFMPFHFTG